MAEINTAADVVVAAAAPVAPAAPVVSVPTAPAKDDVVVRQQKIAAAQPRLTAGEQNRRKAIRILLAKGHREAVRAVAEGARPQDRPALEAAVRDQTIPGGIRYGVIRPMLDRLDEVEVNDKFAHLLPEVTEASRLLTGDHGVREAYGAQAALRRAARIRFEGCQMAALERMLECGSLPPDTPATSCEVALRAPPGTRARVLLNGLTKPLWDKVNAAFEAARIEAVRNRNPRSGFTGAHTGKTERRRQNRAARAKRQPEETSD